MTMDQAAAARLIQEILADIERLDRAITAVFHDPNAVNRGLEKLIQEI